MTALALISLVLLYSMPARSYTLQYADASGTLQLKWPTNTISVALSTSLSTPPANIKVGSDVIGAVRRALAQWATAANIQFVETLSNAQSISPSGAGDGVSLITVANTPWNTNAFQGGADRPGRTRVFFNPSNGAITEADITLNPTQLYSTDGTPGTYDLESVFVHEIGHLLGLEHSSDTGATMQPRLGLNGLFDLPSISPRTLSEDDRAGVGVLYGQRLGGISGTITYATGAAAFGANVWAENTLTGQAVAGQVSFANGAYRIEGLPPGEYRVVAEYLDGPVYIPEISVSGPYAGLVNPQASFRTTEIANPVSVNLGAIAPLNISLATGQPFLNPRLLGINGQLSTVAVPLEAGKTYRLYAGGEGLEQVPASGITCASPHVRINPGTLRLEQFSTTFPIISFEVSLSEDIPTGDYSLRFQSSNDEVAYFFDGLTVQNSRSLPPASATDNPEEGQATDMNVERVAVSPVEGLASEPTAPVLETNWPELERLFFAK